MTPRLRRKEPLRLFASVLFGLVVAMVPAIAPAAQPQTITIDGVNDFLAGNLLEDDSGDTETKNWCTNDPEDESPMDILDFYVTNDANNLYIGFGYDRDCFASPQVNLGIAFSVGVEGDGGTTDPFNRKIAWNTITRKPDYVFYVVIDGFNFEALYDWTGAAWSNISATINPAYGSGSNGLGMANDLGFEELSLPLSAFGIGPDDDIFIEAWMTQDGTTKPPLDALCSDGAQTSVAGGPTVFDVAGAPVEMTCWKTYTVLATVDTDPPVLTDVSIDAAGTTITLAFNEPIESAGLGPEDFVLAGGTGGSTITSAAIGGAPGIVELGVDIALTPGNYDVSYDVSDLAANPAAGTAHVAYRTVLFRGLFGPYLAAHSSPPDDFSVEGSQLPLTFALCDNADMTDTGVDDVWEASVNFSFPLDGSGQGSKTVEWKFAHNCIQFEDGIGNRSFTLDQGSPSITVLEHWWDDLDPDAFTDKAIKVIYSVDMFRQAPVNGVDRVSIGGSDPPLVFDPVASTLDMLDDGVAPDAVADDGIYTVAVVYPLGTMKNSEYKFLYNDVFECTEKGNRQIFLNDTLFDDTANPLVMPVAYYDRCFAIGRDVEVVFEVDLSNSTYFPPGQLGLPDADVQLTGNRDPLSFLKAPVPMRDDGVAPDAFAADRVYTASVVFPDNTDWWLEYKYYVNGEYEGLGLPNRAVQLDDAFDAVGNPQHVGPDDVHQTVPVSVDPTPQRATSRLVSVVPNPFNPKTTISYEVTARMPVRIDVLDVRGRLVTNLVDREVEAGTHEVSWTGLDARGDRVASGVYYARLAAAGSIRSAKLVMLK